VIGAIEFVSPDLSTLPPSSTPPDNGMADKTKRELGQSGKTLFALLV